MLAQFGSSKLSYLFQWYSLERSNCTIFPVLQNINFANFLRNKAKLFKTPKSNEPILKVPHGNETSQIKPFPNVQIWNQFEKYGMC